MSLYGTTIVPATTAEDIDEISKAIVGALKLKLLPKEKKAIEQELGEKNSDAGEVEELQRVDRLPDDGQHGDARPDHRGDADRDSKQPVDQKQAPAFVPARATGS